MKIMYSDFFEYQLAEYIWPTSTYIDHLGKQHVFRKYIFLGGIGIFDLKNNKIILGARPKYQSIYIDPCYEAIVVGLYDNRDLSWELYSLSGLRLFPDACIKTQEEVHKKLLEYRKSWEQ